MITEEMVKVYLAIGAGGVSLLTVVWILVFMVKKMYPIISSLKEDNGSYKEIIKNNTDAVKEVSKSNENVATALKLLDNSVGQLGSIIEKHDKRAEKMENDLIKVKERVSIIHHQNGD